MNRLVADVLVFAGLSGQAFVTLKIVGVQNYFVTNLPPTLSADGCGQDGEARMPAHLLLSGSGTRKVHRPAINRLTPPMPSAQIGCV